MPSVGSNNSTKSIACDPGGNGTYASTSSPRPDNADDASNGTRRREPNSGTKSAKRPSSGFSAQGNANNAMKSAIVVASSPQRFINERAGCAMRPDVGSPTLWMKYI